MKLFTSILLLCCFYSIADTTNNNIPHHRIIITGEDYPYSNPAENDRFEKECMERWGIDISRQDGTLVR